MTTAIDGTARAATVKTICGVTFTLDRAGHVQAFTPCCTASTHHEGGLFDGEPTCRACLRPVPSEHGRRVELGDAYVFLAGMILDAGCPCPEGCTDHTLWSLTRGQ